MTKKDIDTICWWIPFKKTRNAAKNFLNSFNLVLNGSSSYNIQKEYLENTIVSNIPIKNKSIVVAGNGKSLSSINYKMLPENFDVFRVNNFYFEDKYYLGKNVTGYFCIYSQLEYQLYNMTTIETKNEYTLKYYYCNSSLDEISTQSMIGKLRGIYFYDHRCYLVNEQKYASVNRLISYYKKYYKKHVNTGMAAILTAINQGYKNIYVAGIDLFKNVKNEESPYFYKNETKHKRLNIASKGYKTSYSDNQFHSLVFEETILKILLEIGDINLYSISEKSEINDILPLAPILENKNEFVVEDKPNGYIKDWLEIPTKKT